MITCSINNIEIVKALYADVSGALKKAQDSKKDFDHKDYMKKLFKDLSEQSSPEVAAKYLQSVPKIIIDAQNNYFEDLFVNLNALSKLNQDFKNSDTGVTAVIKELGDTSNLGEKKDNLQNKKNNSINLNQNPVAPKPVVRLPQRFRTLTPFGGTLQSYIKIDPNLKEQSITPESINQELLYMIRTFDKIKEIQNTTDTLNGVVYDGVKLHFKSITLSAYDKPENQKYLDADTKALIAKSASIINQGTAPKDVVQITELPILLLSDIDGNVLYFDNNGNITTEDSGKPVYQFMRTVRKDGNTFSVTNRYNTEDLLITPEDFADATYDEAIDGPKDKYLVSVKEMMQKEMSDLYDIQQRVISGQEMILPITGISNGIPANLSATKITLSNLLNLPTLNANPIGVIKTIRTIPIAQDGFNTGSAFIQLNGNKFFIERPLITQDLAVEIADVLTNPNISNAAKQEYTDQFLKGYSTNNSSKKFTLIYSKNGKSIYFNMFEKFYQTDPKDIKEKLDLHSSYLKTLDQSQIDKYKETIIKYLTKEGTKANQGRINIIFQNAALESGKYTRLNDAGTGFNRNADYHTFLTTTDSEISLTNADPGFYNYVVNFTTFDTPVGEFINAEKNEKDSKLIDAELNRVIGNALSNEYKAKVKQEDPTQQRPYDSFLVTRYLRDQISTVYNKSQSKTFVQGLIDALKGPLYSYLHLRDAQIKILQDKLNITNFQTVTPAPTAKPPVQEEIVDVIEVLGAESPQDNTVVNRIFNEDTTEDDSIFFDRAGIKKEFINPLKIVQAKIWWNSKKMEPMRKLIEFDRMLNIVNSDSYARFIVAGATLADTGTLGTILVNKEKGTVFQNLTIYHEAWHVFSQLFLTKKQKSDLYNELLNYTDAKGNTPYAKMSLRELEEMLAEDFRNYVKTGKAKQGAQKRNSLFRKIVEFLKQLFGKVLKKFKKQEIVINSLNSPMAARLFNELYIGEFNKYSPSITNQMFTKLDRGPRQIEYPSQDALSPGDGMTVVSSIDNFFAEEVDKLYQQRKAKGEDRKEISLSVIKSPAQKEELYKRARKRFETVLAQEQAKLRAVEGIADFNTLDTLEEIESNAFAIMKNEVYDKEGKLIPEKSGKDKYFFLTSQVTNFDNLSASTKKGERVRGEDYKDTIRIVGDFYKHKTIKKDGRSIDIVLVTRPQDAQTQFDNYLKGNVWDESSKKWIQDAGGAKIFTRIEKKPIVDKAKIDQTQEEIRDNVRVLETTLKNWGDEKSGIVQYHMQNTDFDVAKRRYSVDGELLPEIEELKEDSKGEVKDESEKDLENDGGLGQGNEGTGDVSLQQTMSKETIFVLKTLFKVNSDGTIPTDRFGIKQRADFSKTFAIVAKTIGGIRDRQKAYEKLRLESEKFPELKQLFETKFPNPNKSGATVNTFEFDLARNFFQDFGKPHIDYLQLYGYYDKEVVNDAERYNLNFVVKESDLAIDNLLNKWSNNFATLKGNKYINVSRDNIRSLKLADVVKDFKSKSTSELDLAKQIEFAKVLGIELQNNDNVKSELERSAYYGLPYIFKIVNSINNIEQGSVEKALSKEKSRLVSNFKENPLKVLTDGFSGSLIGDKGTVKQLTQLKRLAELQTTYGYDSSSTAIIRSNQNVGYKEVNWSSGHARAYALNEVENFNQLWEDPRYNYMSHLNPEINTHVRHLKIISSLFPNLEKKSENTSVKFFAQDGFAITDERGDSSGNTTTELDPLSKFIFEFHSFSLAGVAELPRTSEKKFSWGFKVDGGINHPDVNFESAKDPNLYIDIDMFKTVAGEQYARAGFLYGYIQGEFDRIKKFRGPEKEKYLNFTGYNEPVIEDGEKMFSGQTFVAFKGVLSEGTKKRLYALADQQADIEILDYVKNVDKELGKMIKDDITTFFNEKTNEIKELYFNKIPYISRSLLEKFGIDKESLKDEEVFKSYLAKPEIVNALLKAYTYNDFIHKYETSIIMFGDHAQWNHGKEDWSKRIPGLTSDGIGFMFDNQTQNFINDVFNKETYASKLTEKEGNKINYNTFQFSEKMNAAVIKDAERSSIYVDDYEKMWEKDYLKRFSPEVAKEKAAADAKPYREMKESDGIAFVTLDAYRTLKKVGRGWSLGEDALYKKIINGEEISSKDVKEFYSIFKLHYFGTIENDLLPVTGMFKFSVMPIIPGVNAIPGNELDKLHKKMMRQNTQLVLFASGSKGSHITSDGKTDNIYTNKEDKYINTEVDEKGNDVFQFTKNPFYLANFKEVTVMNNSFKEHLPIATQTRAITIDNLFEDGDLKNPDNKPFVDEYTNTIREYSKVLKEDLLNGLGIELIDGRVIGDFTRFVEIIRDEMSQRDTPPHLIKLVNTNLKGQIAMDLSLHPESDSIEKLLVSLIQRGVIKQQTKGEPLVQSPATFTNGIWDTPYLDLTELKEIQKYLGTNTLPFYLANGETRTEEMKVAIALQGDFRNLLNANDLEGNKIETIERLNQLIKNPKWFAKNKKSLTLFGPRIPNDAHNTIEAATVWHFLPESFGNTIITPTEIVAKAGSDFDGDKLFMSMPNIDSEGNFINKGVENFDKVLEETKELEKKKKLPKDRPTSKQIIELQKKYLQNRYLQASVEILMLPENAITLTKPNGTYLVDRYEENVTEFRTGYDKFKNVGGRPSDVNTKGVKIPNTSNHFTAGYNLYVHDANLSLEPSLGILAKLTKSIPMYKAAGAKMPATYNAGITLKVPLDVRFNKNITVNSKGETVISIGAENNVAGENISDTTSHSLQGVLDRAKATFPFELKLVPEAMDVYGYLTRAGVDQEQIVYLLNQPLVSQYLDLQKINESSINNALFGKQKKFMISQNLFIENLKKTLTEDQLKRLVLEINKNKLAAIMKSLPEDLELQVIIPRKEGVYTVAALRNQLNAFVKTGEGINPNSISSILIELPDETKKEIYSYVVPTFDKAGYLLSQGNAYFLIDYIAKNKLANKDEIQTSDLVDIMKKQDSSSLKALMIFAHYVELERQYSRMNDLEKSFTPDTAKVSTTQEAIIRKKKYKTFFSAIQTNVPEYLKQSEEIDQDFLNKLMNESVVSSLIFDDLTIDLLKPLFQTKLDDVIVNYIDDALKENRGEISNAFGVGADGRAEFIRQYGNTLVNFIYQNYLSYSSDATGKLANYPEAINGKEVVVDNTMDVLVKIEEDKILINTRIIEFDFANKSFLENNDTEAAYVNRNYDTFKVGQDPFKNLRSFYRYHIELALLEENNSIDTLADSEYYYFGQMVAKNDGNIERAYIQYISERALSNSYNPYYIMGRTKYSYTNNVLELIDSLENYPALFDRFPILTQISPQRNREGFRIIRLNNRSDVKGALAQDYYNQIRQLGDISIQKLDNPSNNPVITSKDKRISEIFNLFSIMMYYQHGVGKSGTSFNSALDSSQFKDIIMPSTQAFMGNYINPSKTSREEIQSLLNAVYQQTVSRQRFKIMLGTKNEYANADIEAIANELDKKRTEGEIEEFDEDEGSQKIPSEFKKGEKLILDEDVKAFKRYLISSNGVKPSKFTTVQTKFSEFYNGRQQGMPNTAAWMLNSSNLYDMVEISQDSDLLGIVYYENVDLETGYQMIKKGEGPTQPTGVKEVIKNEKGLIIINNAIPLQKTQQIVNDSKKFIEETSFKQTGGSVSWGYGMQWIRSAGLTAKQKEGVVIGKQIGGQEVTQEMVNDLIAGVDPKKIKGLPLYVYTIYDKNGNRLPNIPSDIILTLQEQGIDLSQYDASYNSVYDKNDKGSLIVHQDNTEFNTSPIITVSLGRPMKFITYQLKDSNNYSFGTNSKNKYELTLNTISNKLVSQKLAPELKRQKNFRGDEVIAYGELTPGNLAKYAKMVGMESEALDVLANSIEKIEEHMLTNGAVLVFSNENRNVFHEIIFDEETDKLPMPQGFPDLTINKSYTGMGRPDKMVNTRDYRVVLTLRKVTGATVNNIDIQKLTSTQPTKTLTTQDSENIYSQLGTLTSNIVISNIKTKDGKYDRTANIKEAKVKGRVYTMEVDSDVKSFSNPWASFNRKGTIKTNSTKEAVLNYIDWLTTDKFINVKPERRAFILDILKSGKLKGRQLQYYAELGEPSHATALDYLINKYNWGQPTSTSKTPVFDSLPGKSTTPTMTYAGIGSRQTPQEALDLMPQIAKYLDNLGYTLRSGAAEGADTAFEKGATKKEIFKGFDRTGQREINVANEIHPDLQGAMNASKSKKIKSRLAEGATQEEAEKSGERSAWAVQNLMARNTNQIFGVNLDTPVDFVLFWAQEIPGSIRPKGGTGQAVEMARRKGIPTINLADKNWREQLKAVLSNKPSTQPTEVKPGGEQSSINDDMAEYTKLVEQNNGAQPKTFTVGTRTWTLNKFGNYDWSDPTTGQIYMRNINMETGVAVPEPLMNEPVDPALVEESLNFINSNRKLLALDHKLADMGIDINDFLKQVEQIKTMEDYFKAKKTIDKLCQ